MTTDIMCCQRCGNALKIVCPEHGAEFVPDRRMVEQPGVPVADMRKSATAAKRPQKRGEVRLKERIVRAMQAGDPDVAWSTADIARALDAAAPSTSAELCVLRKEGRVVRISMGVYRLAP